MHKIFVIEDHPAIRRNYALLLEREPDMELCGVAATSEEALAYAVAASPDVIILDISLGDGDGGLKLLPLLCRQMPNARVLVVSGNEASVYGDQVRRLGAHGYVTKGDVMALVEALRKLVASISNA